MEDNNNIENIKENINENNNEKFKNEKNNDESKDKIKIVILVVAIIVIFFINFSFARMIYMNMKSTVSYKPIIYLYPEEEENVSVKLGYKNNLTVSYPKYLNGWNVIAKPNGDLIDLDTNKSLYALYYENNNKVEFKVEKYGFCIKGTDSAEFLERTLAKLGLNARESEEFIVYWLPKLETNKYNYIRFATMDEINENMPLEITPKPDNVIRILMTFKGLNNPIEVQEQKIVTPERSGFVAVEWGATEIK